MAGIVVEYARFLEVRLRRARIAEALTQPPPEAVAMNRPARDGDHVIERGLPCAETSVPHGVIDVR